MQLGGERGVRFEPVDSDERLQRLVRSGSFDRFYSAMPYRYHRLDFGALETVFTLHGFRKLEMPTDRYEGRYRDGRRLGAGLKRLFPGAYVRGKRRAFGRLLDVRSKRHTVIVPSFHTKYVLLAEFPRLAPERVLVMYSPAAAATPTGSEPDGQRELLQRIGLRAGSYILLISGDRWIKNSLRALQALDRLFDEHPEIDEDALVLGVPRPLRAHRRLRRADRFRFHGYVEPETLDGLYADAAVFVYPTLNEGFGYPPLECMRHGTPVVCSAIAATTEVCGDAVLYVNPYSLVEIRARVLRALRDEPLRAELAARGRGRHAELRRIQDTMLERLITMLLEPAAS